MPISRDLPSKNIAASRVQGGAVQHGVGAAQRGDPLSSKNLMADVEHLAKGFPTRVFGSPQGERAAQAMAAKFQQIGLAKIDGAYLQDFTWDIAGEKWPGHNVVGLLEGTDPKLKDEVVLVCAHVDSVEGTEGANDNATGCAGVLAIAKMLMKDKPLRSVAFVLFDGEEGLRHKGYQPGRRGSKHYAANPLFPLAKTALMVNMDMIGQVHLESGPRREIYQWASGDPFAKNALGEASKKTLQKGDAAIDGYPEQPYEAQFFTTDAEPLFRLSVPTVNFLSGRDLENHKPTDKMPRVIPERLEQYARLAHQVVVEGANDPRALSEVLPQAPGGLLPTYPLIQNRVSVSNHVFDEEDVRLASLIGRLPRFRDAAAQVSAKVDDALLARLGIDRGQSPHGSEIELHAAHARHAELVDAYHAVPKADVATRAAMADELAQVAGVVDVLAGSLYLRTMQDGGAYYRRRIPEKLDDLVRGANALGHGAILQGVVDDADLGDFTAKVSADRAIEIAKESISSLADAFGRAAFALVDPQGAAQNERSVMAADLDRVRTDLVQTAAAVVVDRDDAPAQLARTILGAAIGGVKGAGAKWVDRFAAQNARRSFADLTADLAKQDPSLAQAARAVDALMNPAGRPGQAGVDAAALGDAVVVLADALLTKAGGVKGSVASVDDVVALAKPGRVDLFVDAGRAQQAQVDVRAAAKVSPAVARLVALEALVDRAMFLSAMFGKHGLQAGLSLDDVRAQLRALDDAAKGIPEAFAVRAELAFWSDWLTTFTPLEQKAGDEAQSRKAVARKAQGAVLQAWSAFASTMKDVPAEHDAVLKQGPVAFCDATSKHRDWLRSQGQDASHVSRLHDLAKPFADAQGGFQWIEASASPKAAAFAADAGRAIAAHPAATPDLKAAVRDARVLQAVDAATLVRGQGNTPLRLRLQMAAPAKRDDAAKGSD